MGSSYTLEIIIKGKNLVSGAADEAAGRFDNLGKKALGAGVAIGAAGIAIGGAMLKLAKDAAPVEGIKNAFEGLAESAGVGSEEMLKALQKGSLGMVSNRDLMLSFNKAAQLVSLDFAQNLPEAMGYLGKVSAATGQDMDYMMSSLVTGVGRLSPMILDNLGIQVDLTQAYEDYAVSIGKSVKELTKSEQQTALMNQVMVKLEENTAAMPDITDNASTKFAQLAAAGQNLRDQIGLALIPIVLKLFEVWGKFTDHVKGIVMPILKDLWGQFQKELPGAIERAKKFFQNSLLPVLNRIWQFIQNSIIPAVQELATVFFEQVLPRAIETVSRIFTEALLPALEKMIEWFEFLLPIAIDLLVSYWEGVLLPALEMGANFLIDTLVPAFISLSDWLMTNIPAAIEAIGSFINNTLIPTLQSIADWFGTYIPLAVEAGLMVWRDLFEPIVGAVVSFITNAVLPIVADLIVHFKEFLPDAWNGLKFAITNVLLPAIGAVYIFLSSVLVPAIVKVIGFFEVALPVAYEAVETAWNEVLKPVLQAIHGFFRDEIQPAVIAIGTALAEDIPAAFQAVQSGYNTYLKPAFDLIIGGLKEILGFIGDVVTGIQEITTLGTGRTNPLTASALAGLAEQGAEIPGYQRGGVMPHTGLAFLHQGETILPTGVTNNNFSLTINTNAQTENILADFEMMRAWAS